MRFSRLAPISCLLPLISAHFTITYPSSRGDDENTMPNFPCGGQSPSTNRTAIPLNDPQFSLALDMGHDQTALQVLIGLGTDPGSNFNVTLVPTFRVEGLGSFCLPDIAIANLGANLTDGMNATLQVVSNGDPSGGLYNCADITFTSTATYSVPSSCTNGTGITATPFSGASAARNANESTAEGQAQSGSSSGSSSSKTSTAGSVPMKTAAAAWGVFGAAFVGGLAVL